MSRYQETASNIERDFGEQPIVKIMALHGLKAHDLVAGSAEQITHKMVSRAVKGRRLTPNVQLKILRSLNKVTGKRYQLKDIFNYK